MTVNNALAGLLRTLRTIPGRSREVIRARALEELPADMRARFVHISRLIEESFGLEHVREPDVTHLRGPLWEMRRKGKDFAGSLRYRRWPARRCSPRVHQEDAERKPGG